MNIGVCKILIVFIFLLLLGCGSKDKSNDDKDRIGVRIDGRCSDDGYSCERGSQVYEPLTYLCNRTHFQCAGRGGGDTEICCNGIAIRAIEEE